MPVPFEKGCVRAMYKIGIIGDRNTVQGFMALGFVVADVENVQEAAQKLHTMARSGKFAVLFLTENYAAQLEEETNRYKDLPLPAIVSIPATGGSTGYGMNNIRSSVERAVGADILFKE